jgi:predicted AlkP superfamily phosphohydrolase/phosphomutase
MREGSVAAGDRAKGVGVTGRPRRLLLIGVDAAVPGRWRRFAAAGVLPVGRRLLADGCFARALPAMPTLTTTNWATIATGAWPSTHSVTDFNPHRPGDLPDQSPQGFDARAVSAETVWEAAGRGGLQAVVVNWPGAWPPRPATPRGRLVVAGGAGIELDEWRIGLPGRERRVALAAEQCFSTEGEPGAVRVALPPDGAPFALPFSFAAAFDPVTPGFTLTCRLAERSGRPVARFTMPGTDEALAELAVGEWSERLVASFVADGRTVPGLFMLKLLDLDPAAGRFRLYVTDVCRPTWLEQPAGVLDDWAGFGGLPTPGVGWDSFAAGRIDLDTLVDLIDLSSRWLADACAHLLEREPCDLLCTHFHAVDTFYHLCLDAVSRRATSGAGERLFEEAELRVYRVVDEAVGRLVEAAGGDALVVLVSDHGAMPPGQALPLASILRDAGLLLTDTDGRVDWSRTLAAPQGTCFVRLNRAGREPQGIVGRGEAARVLERVLAALRAYRDPATSVSPFTLVAPAERAAALGVGGPGAGDVVYAVRPQFSEVHGSMLPDETVAAGDWGMPALCLFAGAGAAHGELADHAVRLIDVAPTVCHALGVPAPARADGTVRGELLSQ